MRQKQTARRESVPAQPPLPQPRLPDRHSKPAQASARPPRCLCGGRTVTVRLWWAGTPIPRCRASLVARQARILSWSRQPQQKFPRVPNLQFSFSTSLVKPASTRRPDLEAEIATSDEPWQERTFALMRRHSAAEISPRRADDKHSPTPRGAPKVVLGDVGGRALSSHSLPSALSGRRSRLRLCQGHRCKVFD